MKTYEEKTQRVFQKIEEEAAARRQRSRTVKRVAAPVLSLCLVAAAGFGAWQAGLFPKSPAISAAGESGIPIPNPDGTIQREERPDTVPSYTILRPGDEGYVAPVPTPEPGTPDEQTQIGEGPDSTGADASTAPEGEEGVCIDAGFRLTQWGNKAVLRGLADALEEAPADRVFDILAHPYIDYGFVFEGRTLAEYYSDMCEERNLPEILAQLLKEGDALKYGTALYESGTPEGEKWAQSLYEERIEFYGTGILDKYIADGEFLRGQVESDLEAAGTAKEKTRMYKTAFAAYYRHLIESLQISVPADVKETDGILLHMTAGEFRDFTADHIEGWSFSWDGPQDEDQTVCVEDG